MTTTEGTVLETLDAANYTYVKVKTASGEIWAAAPTSKVAVGEKVVVPLDAPMQNFHSQSLKRDFPVIYFAQRIGRPGEAPSAMTEGTSPHGPASAAVAPVTGPIPQPAGGVTVADIIGNRKAMDGKTVTVRGKVMKYNGGIMNLNWLHIQDGTGAAKEGTNDLAVTSKDGTASVGDIVTITGTVVVDKDFGYGYHYPVLLQNATIAAK